VSYLLFSLPLCLVISLVVAAAHDDEPRVIVRKGLKSFAALVLLVVVAGIVVFALQEWTGR